jgi:hypothetical protein
MGRLVFETIYFINRDIQKISQAPKLLRDFERLAFHLRRQLTKTHFLKSINRGRPLKEATSENGGYF